MVIQRLSFLSTEVSGGGIRFVDRDYSMTDDPRPLPYREKRDRGVVSLLLTFTSATSRSNAAEAAEDQRERKKGEAIPRKSKVKMTP